MKQLDILLIEDNAADVKLIQVALRERKLINELFVATDGDEALDFLRKIDEFRHVPTPDLILLDLNLPGKDGREVLREIKMDPKLKMIPVLILTTSQAEGDIINTYNLHANCFITKPIDFDEFLNVIRTIEDFWLCIVKLPPNTNRI